MKKIILLLAAIVISEITLAQGNGKISGAVKDASTDVPVEYATVALNNPSTGSPVDGSVCDDKGKFVINKVAYGQYNLVVSFIGFDSKTIPVTISEANSNIDLGTISISAKAEILNEVTVEAQKALIEERVDRTIYNAENDMTTRGGDASDVLKRVPMLSVDLDGNVSLRGNSNIRVLVNNKPSAIMASNVADALKQIPAEDIKSVEVITSPSAKYDAEGSAGIINIITKKNVLEGATLGINTSAGLRGSHLGLNGAYRKGKVGLTLGGWGRAGYNVNGSFSNEQRLEEGNTTRGLLQYADTESEFLFGRYNLGLDYDINKNNFITTSVQYGLRNNNSLQNNFKSEQYFNGALVGSDIRNVDVTNERNSIDLNFGFTHLYDKPQKEFSVLAMYSIDNGTNDFLDNTFDETTFETTSRRKNLNDSYNREVAVQFDYQTPVAGDDMLEFGAKETWRAANSDFALFTASGPDGEFVLSTDERLSNALDYEQTVAAGYLSYTLNLNAYSIKAGGRYEYTSISASFQDEATIEIPSYGVFVPSVNLSRKLKNGNMIKAAYNRRIQRPSIQFLNPNFQSQNDYNQTVGDPNLGPEYTNNYELSYSYFIKGTSLNFSSFYRNTTDAIQSVRDEETLGEGRILTTYKNIGKEDAYGLSIFANVNIGGKLSLNGGGDIYYSVLDNTVISNEGLVYSYRLFGGYEIGNGWGIQLFGFYRGNRVELQGSQGGFGIYSLSVKKDFANKKGSIGLGAENFFNIDGFKMRNEINSGNLNQASVNVMRNMNFKINFSYRIGKLGEDRNAGRRSNRSINSDDLKQGGDDTNGGLGGDMQMQQPQQRRGFFQRSAPAPKKTEVKSTVPDSTAVDATGKWAYNLDSPQGGNGEFTITKKEDGTLDGIIKNNRMPGDTPLSSITVQGNTLSFSYTVSFGGNEVEVSVNGTIEENKFNGTMNFGQFRSIPMTGTRD